MAYYLSRFWSVVLLLCAVLLLGACANRQVVFTPPEQRTQDKSEQPWPRNHYLVLAYHDVEDEDPDQTFLSVRTDHLAEQFAWLRDNGYQPVSIDQILAAQRGGPPLPDQAVLLSFDDGYRSFYTRVLPLLEAFKWPALLAPVGSWMDTPSDMSVNFGGKPVDRKRFLTWAQITEISRSGLVEIGAHTDALHHGVIANPQGNEQPAAAAHIFNRVNARYESSQEYEQRIRKDVQRISEKIRRATGKSPRVWVWPYGEANGRALKIIGEAGYEMAMNLEKGLASPDRPMNIPRLLIHNDPPLAHFAQAVINMENKSVIRVAHVDLDYVYDSDPEQMDRNLGQLVQRIADLGVDTVFLQAFADPEGDGLVRELYFPNRHLPMRADLFNRAAWQLRSRAFVEVFAWMPVLSFELGEDLERVSRWYPAENTVRIDPDQYRRLSPFDPEARQKIAELYEDLAEYAIFAGILFHDDALLSDFEDAGPSAVQAYRSADLGDSVAQIRANPDTFQRWTRFKSQYLVDFTQQLTDRVKAIRGPQVKTARNIFAAPVLQPESEAWFAQNLDDFLKAYDWTAPMAMPWMEGVQAQHADAWLRQIVQAVSQRPGALERTVFELQARDWRPTAHGKSAGYIDTHVLARWIRLLQLSGARSVGYYPDDFVQDHPRLEVIRPYISNNWYPYK